MMEKILILLKRTTWPFSFLSTYSYNIILFFFFFSRILQLEEEFIQRVCSDIIALKPDVVFTEKGVSGENFFYTDVN